MKDACDEAEILKAKEENRKAHAEELKNMLDNVGSRMHNEDMEGDIRRCWTAMRAVTSARGNQLFQSQRLQLNWKRYCYKHSVKFQKVMLLNRRSHHLFQAYF